MWDTFNFEDCYPLSDSWDWSWRLGDITSFLFNPKDCNLFIERIENNIHFIANPFIEDPLVDLLMGESCLFFGFLPKLFRDKYAIYAKQIIKDFNLLFSPANTFV